MKRGRRPNVQISSTVHRLVAAAAVRLRKTPVYDGRGATIREICERGILRELETLQEEHNGGRPFQTSRRASSGRPPLIREGGR